MEGDYCFLWLEKFLKRVFVKFYLFVLDSASILDKTDNHFAAFVIWIVELCRRYTLLKHFAALFIVIEQWRSSLFDSKLLFYFWKHFFVVALFFKNLRETFNVNFGWRVRFKGDFTLTSLGITFRFVSTLHFWNQWIIILATKSGLFVFLRIDLRRLKTLVWLVKSWRIKNSLAVVYHLQTLSDRRFFREDRFLRIGRWKLFWWVD